MGEVSSKSNSRAYIECRPRFGSNFLRIVFLISIPALLMDFTLRSEASGFKSVVPIWWFIWFICTLFNLWTPSRIVIQDDGIELIILNRTRFVPWNEVVKVIRFGFYTNIRVKKLTTMSVIIGFLATLRLTPIFSLDWSMTNYREAVDFIEAKIPSRVEVRYER
jgi:hypothetical protein